MTILPTKKQNKGSFIDGLPTSKEDFLTLFLPSSNYAKFLITLPFFDAIENRFEDLTEIKKEYIERIENNNNYNLFVYSHFQESGTGKSTFAIWLAEELQKIFGFSFMFSPTIEHFLLEKRILEKCIYLIDDTTVDEIGLGSKRIKRQFLNFLAVASRHRQVCFILTTTLDLKDFDFLVNLHRLISVIGFSRKYRISLAYTFQKSLVEAKYLFGQFPKKETIEEYLIMKDKYCESFVGGQEGNLTIKQIVKDAQIMMIKNYNKKELEALLQAKVNLTGKEISQITTMLKMKEEYKLSKYYYSLEEYKENKEIIDSNIHF